MWRRIRSWVKSWWWCPIIVLPSDLSITTEWSFPIGLSDLPWRSIFYNWRWFWSTSIGRHITAIFIPQLPYPLFNTANSFVRLFTRACSIRSEDLNSFNYMLSMTNQYCPLTITSCINSLSSWFFFDEYLWCLERSLSNSSWKPLFYCNHKYIVYLQILDDFF